jgi:phosphoglycerol transferase MdoB-like AlkP superfamily enzyme
MSLAPAKTTDPGFWHRLRLWLPPHIRFLTAVFLLLMVLFSLARGGLLLRNASSDQGAAADIAGAFLVGLRFDLCIASYFMIPIAIVCYLWRGFFPNSRRLRLVFMLLLTLVLSLTTLAMLAEFEFFAEFRSRYNQLAIRYLTHPLTVGGMIWNNYPVGRYLLIWSAVTVLIYLVLQFAARRAFDVPGPKPTLLTEAVCIFGLVAFLVISARGGLQIEPLRWGSAFWSRSEFANQLTLNGFFSLSQAVRDAASRGRESAPWVGRVPIKQARITTRQMLFAPGETPLKPDTHVVLRSGPASTGSPFHLTTKSGRPANVVIVMMESFSARYTGACGAPGGKDAASVTPYFDALAKDGLLFTRALSPGSHTHQGIFAIQLGFPNLPGYETLMESAVSNQPFLSVPNIFSDAGHHTLFLYNGDFAWDNMYGFFTKQGVDRFIGGGDMKAEAKFLDAVWGVSDGDLFDRANREFQAASERGPFMAAVMTLSNHAPFQVPPVPGAMPITDQGEENKRLEALRYADYAVGKFIEDAKKLPYFQDTLFVFVGDHGFHVAPVLTEVHLLYHHVPLLFYAPGLTTSSGQPFRGVDSRLASQVSILPTILDLLNMHAAPHASWGRSLLAAEGPSANADFADTNFVVFKMSGGGRAVAIAQDDKLLVLGSGSGRPLLMNFSLGFPPSITPLNDAATERAMESRLRAYLQAALHDLMLKQAGP